MLPDLLLLLLPQRHCHRHVGPGHHLQPHTNQRPVAEAEPLANPGGDVLRSGVGRHRPSQLLQLRLPLRAESSRLGSAILR